MRNNPRKAILNEIFGGTPSGITEGIPRRIPYAIHKEHFQNEFLGLFLEGISGGLSEVSYGEISELFSRGISKGIPGLVSERFAAGTFEEFRGEFLK